MKHFLIQNQEQKSRFIFLLSNFALFLLWLLFAVRHLNSYFRNPQIYIIIFIISELIVAFLFLTRKKEISISTNTFDQLMSISGTFLPLLFIPGGKIYFYNLGIILMTVGVVFQTISALSLNRSLGIIPADRGIKTNGAYKIIRHPMYFCYLLTYTGYIVVSFSLFNLYLYIFTILVIFIRIKTEEDFLKKIPAYSGYFKKVKNKLIPFIY